MRDSDQTADEARPPVRDETSALKVAAGNPELARDLLAAFLKDLRPQFQAIRALCNAGDRDGLRETAHRLHGAAAYCGVPALKQALKRLEMAAAGPDGPRIEDCMEALEREIERLFAYAASAGVSPGG